MEEPGNPLDANQTWPKVILFGDSLTQRGYNAESGWVSMLSDRLVRKCDVINRGFSGYTARYCHVMAPRVFSKVGLVGTAAFVVFLGANDANRPGSVQHVPLAEYQERMINIAKYVNENGVGADKIIFLSPPPVVDEKWIKHCQGNGKPSDRFEAETRDYVEACAKAANATGAEFVDLHKYLKSQKNWEDFLSDGLHFSRTGAEQVFRALWPSIRKRTAGLPVIGPLWSEIQHDQPEKALFK